MVSFDKITPDSKFFHDALIYFETGESLIEKFEDGRISQAFFGACDGVDVRMAFIEDEEDEQWVDDYYEHMVDEENDDSSRDCNGSFDILMRRFRSFFV